jgi:hypothetical protein
MGQATVKDEEVAFRFRALEKSLAFIENVLHELDHVHEQTLVQSLDQFPLPRLRIAPPVAQLLPAAFIQGLPGAGFVLLVFLF